MIHDLIQCSIFFPCALNEIMAQQAELKILQKIKHFIKIYPVYNTCTTNVPRDIITYILITWSRPTCTYEIKGDNLQAKVP